MEEQNTSFRHPFTQLLMLVLITLVCAITFTFLAIAICIVLYRLPADQWNQLMNMNNPSCIPAMKFLQIAQSLSMFVIPPILFGWFISRNPWKYLNVNRAPNGKMAAIVVLIGMLIIPAINLLGLLNQEMRLPGFMAGIEEWMKSAEERAGDLTDLFLTVNTFPAYLVNLLMIVIIPALGEEFFFRGVLQKIFHQWFKNPHMAVLFVAIIFSAFHMQFYGFFPRFVLGVLFGYLFLWSGNIWYPIVAHMINNFLPVTIAYLSGNNTEPSQLDTLGTGPEAWAWAVPSIILSMAAIAYFYRQFKIRNIYE